MTEKCFPRLSKQKSDILAQNIASVLEGHETILLFGKLGAGKTFFTTLLCKHLGVESLVNSPSYVLLNEYEGVFKVNHYDLYRLTSKEEAIELGIYDKITDGITIIEWPELIADSLPVQCIRITFNGSGSTRDVVVHGMPDITLNQKGV